MIKIYLEYLDRAYLLYDLVDDVIRYLGEALLELVEELHNGDVATAAASAVRLSHS